MAEQSVRNALQPHGSLSHYNQKEFIAPRYEFYRQSCKVVRTNEKVYSHGAVLSDSATFMFCHLIILVFVRSFYFFFAFKQNQKTIAMSIELDMRIADLQHGVFLDFFLSNFVRISYSI